MENREVVSLQFEFECLRNKSQSRESELIAVLNEKDATIGKLQQSLTSLAGQKLRDKQKVRHSVVEAVSTDTQDAAASQICVQCVDYKCLLEENEQVTAAFEKLTLEYEKLQLSLQPLMSNDATFTQTKLSESEQIKSAEAIECDALRKEIGEIRAKLVELQLAYEQTNCDKNEKTETCAQLNNVVAMVRQEMQLLQAKYDKLELTWQQQQNAIQDIQVEYDAIQVKYDGLQVEYERLAQSKDDTQKLFDHLQCENKNLQEEIALLKTRVEEAQRELLQEQSQERDVAKLKATNAQLQLELEELQKQFNNLQQEYDVLSNQLMESIQESDALRKKCGKLEKEHSSQQQLPNGQLRSHVSDLQYSDVDSMKSSGVCTEYSESDIEHELLQRFKQLATKLYEIEWAYDNGSRRLFRSKELGERATPAFKLCIRQSQEIVETSADCLGNAIGGRVCMQGILKQNRFHIVEINSDNEEKELQTYVAELEQEIEKKNLLLEATERTINDMREHMINLESALFEKSIIVEKVEDYQRQIVSLEKQNAKITIVCEELQQKVKECTMSESLMHETDTNSEVDTDKGNDALSCSNKTMDLEMLRTEKSALESQLKTLQSTFEEMKTALEASSEMIKQLQHDLREMTAARTIFEEQHTLQVELSHETSRNADQLIESLRKEILDLKSELVTNMELVSELKASVKEANAQLDMQKQASIVGMDTAFAELKASYAKELETLNTSLEAAKAELETNEKQYKNEINQLNLEFYEKLEVSESEFRKNMQEYNRDWEKSKESYEAKLKELEEKLATRIAEQVKQTAKSEETLAKYKAEHDVALEQLKQEKHELESTNDGNKKLLEKLRAQLHEREQSTAAHAELMETAELLKAKCEAMQANEERSAQAHACFVTQMEEEVAKLRATHAQQMESYACLKTDFEVKLEILKQEKTKLEEDLAQCRQEANDLCEQLTKSSAQFDSEKRTQKTQLEKHERLSKKHDEVMAELTALKKALEEQQYEYKNMKEAAEKRAEDFEQKIDALKQDLHSAQLKSSMCEQLMLEQACVKQLLEATQTAKYELEQRLAQKTAELESQTEGQTVILTQFRESLDVACKRERLLEEKLQALTAQLTAEQLERKEQCKNVENAMNELQLKYETLQADKMKLEDTNAELRVQLRVADEKCKECEMLSNFKLQHSDCEDKCKKLQAAYRELEQRMARTDNEASRSNKKAQEELSQAKLMLTENDAKLRKLMRTKESAFEETKVRLEATVSCLLSEKKNLEDKFTETEQIIKRLQLELSGCQRKTDSSANSSMDSNTSWMPTARKSLDRALGERNQIKAGSFNVEEKMQEKQQRELEARRSRRLSAHDERRLQSYRATACEVGIMTDPLDVNCKCAELSAKLEDCESKLYISEGLVKSLRMDIRNHPLKDENALLKKRLQEEQDKTHIELRRLKKKNHDLLVKIEAQTEEPRPAVVPIRVAATQNAVTQTDGTGNNELQKLQSKNEDLMRVVRFRYNLIKDLEKKLSEKENAAENSDNALERQVGLLNKELNTIKEKLNYAKQALWIRRKRIEELEAQIAEKERNLSE